MSMARGLIVRTLGRLHTFCQQLIGVNDTLLAEGKAGTPGLNRMACEMAQEWTYMVVHLLKFINLGRTRFRS